MHERTVRGNPTSVSVKPSMTIVALVAGIAVGTAAPAAASESDYLRLKDSLTFLTTEQLLSEGYRACGAVHSGTRSTDAVNMVMNELGVSVNAALDIIAAAVVDLGC